MNRLSIPHVNEELHCFRHQSGLRVYLLPKNFRSTYGILGVNFGSISEKFRILDKEFSVPLGSAHFLEHKMFENEDGEDTFEKFALTGASANAYTANDRTCYLFSTTDQVENSLEILLSSVFSPYFTEANIKKEIGIISQEIKMYEDDPGDALYYAVLKSMYENCPLKNNICGSVSSIRNITPKDLYTIYDAFYKPSNMVLVMAGKYDEEKILKLLDRLVPIKDETVAHITPFTEPKEVKRRYVRLKRDLSLPLVTVGIKDTAIPKTALERQKKFTVMNVLCTALFSASGDFVSGLLEKGLIPDEPYYEIVHNAYYSNILFSSYTHEPKELFKRLEEYLLGVSENGIPFEDFERAKKVAYSSEVCSFNSLEEIANEILSDALEDDEECALGEQTVKYPDLILNTTYQDVLELSSSLFQKNFITYGAIYPKNEKENEK